MPRVVLVLVMTSAVLTPLVGSGSAAGQSALEAKIAFSGGDINIGTAIWTVNADGTELVQVTHPPISARDDEPAWSPDRSQIAFVRAVVVDKDFRGDNIFREHLTVMNADGSLLRGLAVHSHDPAWSPDGRSIAFVKYYAEDEWIWTIKPDGTGARRLAPGGHPSWSPDGRQIAFDRWTGHRTEAFVMRSDGSAPRKLVPRSKLDSNLPAWSPNGRQIAFRGCRCSSGFVGVSLYGVSANGTNLERLAGGVSSSDASIPIWSPDGSRLLFERGRGGGPESVYVLRLGDGGLRRLATNAWYPDWSPDGRTVAFGRPFRDLRVVSASGGPSSRVAREEARYIDW